MVEDDILLKEAIEEAKESEIKQEVKENITEVSISFNPEAKNPLYTIRIPRELAKRLKIKKGDKMVFKEDKDKLSAKLVRGE